MSAIPNDGISEMTLVCLTKKKDTHSPAEISVYVPRRKGLEVQAGRKS